MRLIEREELEGAYVYICDGGDKLKAVEKLYHYEEIADEPQKVVAIDRVLEIINRRIVIQEMKQTEANDILHETIAEIRATEVKEIRNKILELWRDKE